MPETCAHCDSVFADTDPRNEVADNEWVYITREWIQKRMNADKIPGDDGVFVHAECETDFRLALGPMDMASMDV